jgi:hypothetical protein
LPYGSPHTTLPTPPQLTTLNKLFDHFKSVTHLSAVDNMIKSAALVSRSKPGSKPSVVLIELNLSRNQLAAFANLTGCDNLLTLNLSRNEMAGNWDATLGPCKKLQVANFSKNSLAWDEAAFKTAMSVLAGSAGASSLQDLNLSGNAFVDTVSDYRPWVASSAPGLQMLDGAAITDAERKQYAGKVKAAAPAMPPLGVPDAASGAGGASASARAAAASFAPALASVDPKELVEVTMRMTPRTPNEDVQRWQSVVEQLSEEVAKEMAERVAAEEGYHQAALDAERSKAGAESLGTVPSPPLSLSLPLSLFAL